MNKTIFRSLLAVSLIATLLMAGCQKDSTTLRVRIDNFGGNSKVYMGSNNHNIPMWSQISDNYDTIWIDHSDNADNSYVITEVSNAGATITVPYSPGYYYCALYPYGMGSVSGTTATLNIPQVQRYYEKGDEQVVNAPMAACTQNDQSGSITFHNLGALLAINIECNLSTQIDVEEVMVRSESGFPLWGTADNINISNTDATYQCSASTPASNEDPTHSTIYLRKYRVVDGQEVQVDLFTMDAHSTKIVYVYVPAVPQNTNNHFSIEVKASRSSDGEDCSMLRTQLSQTGGNLVRNMMVNVPFAMADVHIPYIEGKFKINSNGNQVYFAQGNLQWRPTTTMGNARDPETPDDPGRWRIAQNQYDFIGNGVEYNSNNIRTSSVSVRYNDVLCNNDNVSSNSYSGWVDLFGWATSGWDNTGNDPTAVRYHPYDYLSGSSITTDNNADNPTHYGPASTLTTTLDGNYDKYDWGVYNSVYNSNVYCAIADGPDQLTDVHWRTLTIAEWQYIFTGRRVRGSYGPGYTYSRIKYSGIGGILLYPDDYSGDPVGDDVNVDNIPPKCVFLPFSGSRNNTPQFSGGSGYYWSTTGNTQNGFALIINNASSNQVQFLAKSRPLGYAVRLVTPVQ